MLGADSNKQREEPRLRLPLPIISEWQTEDGGMVRVRAWSNNVSHHGLCLILDEAAGAPFFGLSVGSRIKLAANHHHFLTAGTVRHMERRADGHWVVGLKLDSPLFGWLARYRICSQQLLTNFLPTA